MVSYYVSRLFPNMLTLSGSIRPSIALICLSDALTSAAIFSSMGATLDVREGGSSMGGVRGGDDQSGKT